MKRWHAEQNWSVIWRFEHKVQADTSRNHLKITITSSSPVIICMLGGLSEANGCLIEYRNLMRKILYLSGWKKMLTFVRSCPLPNTCIQKEHNFSKMSWAELIKTLHYIYLITLSNSNKVKPYLLDVTLCCSCKHQHSTQQPTRITKKWYSTQARISARVISGPKQKLFLSPLIKVQQ